LCGWGGRHRRRLFAGRLVKVQLFVAIFGAMIVLTMVVFAVLFETLGTP
jgi:hypothetical protein